MAIQELRVTIHATALLDSGDAIGLAGKVGDVVTALEPFRALIKMLGGKVEIDSKLVRVQAKQLQMDMTGMLGGGTGIGREPDGTPEAQADGASP